MCKICGKELLHSNYCGDCQVIRPSFTAACAWTRYEGPIQRAIKKLKYAGDLGLADILARNLIELLHTQHWDVDLIVPVPQGIARRAERGYNQSALLARPLALTTGIPSNFNCLQKIRTTKSQVGLSLRERRQNVKDAFSAKSKYVTGRNILVVDDVLTSGATLDACAAALKSAGARNVYGITLARTR